ncbi:nsun2 [Symbiodinium necroappetens]|uniref:Nsun2 protein n=1 Tax=Symbiodinium necroappetens TaxID=1628268 RepID=A0A812LTB9_9DINO|nr:nsun2 [Symbiodinium necroappetens]
MSGACSRELAQSLHNGLPPGTIPSGLLVANVAKAESLEDLVREVDLVHRSPVVFTVSQPQRFPQLLTASPGEGFAEWTAPTGREPSGQFLMEFDRVICVPGQRVGLLCPCEGQYEGQAWHRHPLHVRILQRGLGLLRPGGRLVFAALAQHPVENEAVIAAALSRYGPSVQIEDATRQLACPSSLGCTSWSIPNPNKGEEPSHFLSWDDVPLKLRGGKVLRTMFPPRHSEPNGLELGSQLARCLRVGVGPGLFLAVLVKESTAPRICSSPCPVEEDEQSSFPPGSNIMVRASGAFARVVGRGSGPYAGLVKIRYPDRSTYHLEASELQPLSTRAAASPAFTAFKAACLAVTTMSTLFCITRSRRTHTIFHRLKWHSGALLSACIAFACMRSRRRGGRSPVVVEKSPLPGSRVVRGCANVPRPVQSFCSFFGWDLCWEKFRDCLAYRTADKRDLYLVSAAVFQLRVPEQLRQALCGMPVLTRCDVLEKRYWGTGDLKPRSTLTAFLRKHASRRRLHFQDALLQEILDTGRLSLEKACTLESQGQLEGLDSCTSAGILRPGCVLILRSEADDPENSECWLGVLGSRHLEIPEVLHGAGGYSRLSRSTHCLACDMALVARRITRPGWTWTFPLQQVRCSAGSSSDILTASAATDVARLGGAIAARLRQVGSASIRCIGPKAAYRSVKSVVNASDYLSRDPDALEDRFLGMEVSESKARSREQAEHSNELHLRVHPVQLPAGAFQKSKPAVELLVGASTQPGKAAAAMAGALRPMGGGHGKYPLVRGIGTIAIHRALVAAYLAQNYLDNDDRGVRFLVVPRFVQEVVMMVRIMLAGDFERYRHGSARIANLSLSHEGQAMSASQLVASGDVRPPHCAWSRFGSASSLDPLGGGTTIAVSFTQGDKIEVEFFLYTRGYERGFAPLHAGWNAVLSVTLCSSRPSNWVWLRATESKMKLLGNRKSKKQKLSRKYNIQKRIREHKRRVKKEAKKLGLKKRVRKDPGIPNSLPWKAELLAEIEAKKAKREEELARKKQEAKNKVKQDRLEQQRQSQELRQQKDAERRKKRAEQVRLSSLYHRLLHATRFSVCAEEAEGLSLGKLGKRPLRAARLAGATPAIRPAGPSTLGEDVSLAVTTPVPFEAATISGDSSPAALFGDSMTFQQRDSGPRRQLPAEAPSAGYGDTADYRDTVFAEQGLRLPPQAIAQPTRFTYNADLRMRRLDYVSPSRGPTPTPTASASTGTSQHRTTSRTGIYANKSRGLTRRLWLFNDILYTGKFPSKLDRLAQKFWIIKLDVRKAFDSMSQRYLSELVTATVGKDLPWEACLGAVEKQFALQRLEINTEKTMVDGGSRVPLTFANPPGETDGAPEQTLRGTSAGGGENSAFQLAAVAGENWADVAQDWIRWQLRLMVMAPLTLMENRLGTASSQGHRCVMNCSTDLLAESSVCESGRNNMLVSTPAFGGVASIERLRQANRFLALQKADSLVQPMFALSIAMTATCGVHEQWTTRADIRREQLCAKQRPLYLNEGWVQFSFLCFFILSSPDNIKLLQPKRHALKKVLECPAWQPVPSCTARWTSSDALLRHEAKAEQKWVGLPLVRQRSERFQVVRQTATLEQACEQRQLRVLLLEIAPVGGGCLAKERMKADKESTNVLPVPASKSMQALVKDPAIVGAQSGRELLPYCLDTNKLVFLDEQDYVRLFRTELEEQARRAILRRKRCFLPFDDCVKWVRAMGLWDNQEEWEEPLGKLGQWKGWAYFLGAPGTEASPDREGTT